MSVPVNTSRLCCKNDEVLHINPEELVCINTDCWMVCRKWRRKTKWQSRLLPVYCLMSSYNSVDVYNSFGVTGCIYDWNISVTGRSRVEHNKRHEKRKSHDMLTSVSFFLMIVLYQDLFADRLTLLLHYTFQAWISCKKRLEIEYIPYRKTPGSPLQGHCL